MIRLAFAVALAVCLVSVPARADPPVAAPSSTAQLEYTLTAGAERCPGDQELRDAVSARLGRDPFTPQALHRLTVRLGGVGSQLFGDVYLVDMAGQARGRRFVAPSGECARLIASITLDVSLALSPLPVAPAQADRQPRPMEVRAPARGPWAPQPSAASTPTRTAPPATSPPRAPPWGVEVSAWGGVAANVAPNTAGGLAVGVALNKGSWWSIGIETRGYFPNSTDEADGASAAVSSFMVGAMPCARTSTWLPIPVFGCLVAAVGALHTEGTGVDVPQEDSDVYVGLGGRVGFEIPLMSRLALRVHGEVAWVPVTWDVRLAGEVVWDTPPVMVGAGGGFVTYF